MRRLLLTTLVSCLGIVLVGQPVHNTFTSTRILNSHSNETLRKRQLEFRITHRFGDIAGDNGGWDNFYGLDNAADIRTAFEYGVTDDFMVGIGRNKGPHQRGSIFDIFGKYALLRQTEDNKRPLSLALQLNTGWSTMTKSDDTTKVANFPKYAHRFTYLAQLILTRKFGERFSFALLPTFVHRNFVLAKEENDVLALGAAFRLRITKPLAVLIEYYYPLTENGGMDTATTYQHPLGIGFELDTGGHIFLINFTNARAITENEFIPNGDADWTEGQFRFGFTIARKFRI